MKRRSILKMAPGLAVLGTPSVWSQASGEILLGLHGPMTGPASWVGLGARDGTLLAIEEINAKGVDGLIESLAARNKTNSKKN